MKFDNLYKFLVNEEFVEDKTVEDTQELEGDEARMPDEGTVETALEELGLSTVADLSETQKRELAQKAIDTKIYEKVKQGKLSPEDAIDILMNMSDDEDPLDDVDLPDDDAPPSREDAMKKRNDYEDFGFVKRGLEGLRDEQDFQSGN